MIEKTVFTKEEVKDVMKTNYNIRVVRKPLKRG